MLSLRRGTAAVRYILTTMSGDLIQVYAAQASFYIVIAAVPGVMLLVSVLQLILPAEVIAEVFGLIALLPGEFRDTLELLAADVFARPGIPLISVTAAAALWSVTRAMTAVGNGIRHIYGTSSGVTGFAAAVVSVVYAALFILILSAVLVLLVFGGAVIEFAKRRISVFNGIPSFVRTPLTYLAVFVFLSLFFTLLYTLHANTPVIHAGKFIKKYRTLPPRPIPPPDAPRGFGDNLAGGLTAGAGWLLYSFGYSLYLKYFAFGASYLYGSLTAVILLLLWLYFCITILLTGAEVNRYLRRRKKRRAA